MASVETASKFWRSGNKTWHGLRLIQRAEAKVNHYVRNDRTGVLADHLSAYPNTAICLA